MELKNRKTLKRQFENGKMPSEASFHDLIESMVNKVEDGFAKDMQHGLLLSPQGDSQRVMSFFERIDEDSPAWDIRLNPETENEKAEGIGFGEAGKDGEAGETRLFIENGGNVGIGTINPNLKLQVEGAVGMHARIGTYAKGTVDADRKWKDLPLGKGDDPYMTGCQAFEVVAQVNKEKFDKFAILHAIAICAFGRTKTIRKTGVYHPFAWNRLRLRWKKEKIGGKKKEDKVQDETNETKNGFKRHPRFKLQIKTASNYGTTTQDQEEGQIQIKYHISQLWLPDTSWMNL